MILKISPDKKKAESLKNIAETTLKRLEETDKEKYPTNTLKDYYDIIKELMEALNYLDGFKTKGENSHYETIEIISKRYNLSEANREFLQNMREYRNRIAYEGFNIRKSYISQNSERIDKIIKFLLKLL